MNSRHFTVIGAPFNGIGVTPEQENPAQSLREAGLIDLLRSRGASVNDLGDIEIAAFDGLRDEETHVLNTESWKETSLNLTRKLTDVLNQDTRPIVLGGDCGILLGIMGTFAKRGDRAGLVTLDGHTDFRNPRFSMTARSSFSATASLT
jgi:arginase